MRYPVSHYHRLNTASIVGFAIVAPLVLALLGCQDPNLASVSGRVTMDGKPLPDAFVELIPTGEGGSVSYGKTDSDGYYHMMFTRDTPGASLGESRVKITTGDVTDNNGKAGRIKEKVPTRYNSATELSRKVDPGTNEFNFKLSSQGEIEPDNESFDS